MLAKAEAPYWDQEEVHQIYRSWRAVLDDYTTADPTRPRVLCAEANVPVPRAVRYVRPDETWVQSNHDVVRHATRLGYPLDRPPGPGIGLDDPQPDVALGLRRARAATMLMLALPGSAYLYQGEELGLGLGTGTLRWHDGSGSAVLSFSRGRVRVTCNLGGEDVPLPAEAKILLSSSPEFDGRVGTDMCVWWVAGDD